LFLLQRDADMHWHKVRENRRERIPQRCAGAQTAPTHIQPELQKMKPENQLRQ
jgi:hypothetical protein